MYRLFCFLSFTLMCVPAFVHAEAPNSQALFKIERNKNANIVQYDVQLGPDGKLLKKGPVVAYWIRLAEEGQVEQLSWIQKTVAYGFDTRLDRTKDTVELQLKIDIDRPIIVQRDGAEYRAMTRIDGSQSHIEKFFIHATGKGMSTRVDYIELHGDDVESGDKRYEKIVP